MGEPVAISIFKHYGKVSDRFVNICERYHFLVDDHRDHFTALRASRFSL